MKKLILAASLALATSSASAWTPKEINNTYTRGSDTEVVVMTAYVVGVENTITITQDYGFLPNYICFPKDNTIQDTANVLTSVDYKDFEDNDEGGIVMIYTAFLNNHSCD